MHVLLENYSGMVTSLAMLLTVRLYSIYFSQYFRCLVGVYHVCRILLIEMSDNVTSYLILQYDLISGSEYEYLNWFHNIHIPEKLDAPSRQFIARDRLGLLTTVKIEGLSCTFGGISTRTFRPKSFWIAWHAGWFNQRNDGKTSLSQGNVFAFEWSVMNQNVQEPRSNN